MSQYAGRSEVIDVVTRSIAAIENTEQLVCVISGKILRTKDLYAYRTLLLVNIQLNNALCRITNQSLGRNKLSIVLL